MSVLAAVADFLIEPVDATHADPRRAWRDGHRPAVAVAGLGRRCGTTTIARALGVEMASRDREGSAVVTACATPGVGVPLGTAAAGRLAKALARALPIRARAVGKLCLAESAVDDGAGLVEVCRELAPLVLDVADPSHVSLAASLVDTVVLVGTPAVEPALAAVLAQSLRRVGSEPVVILNRDPGDAEKWEGRCAQELPETRLGAQLALAGREPRGELGRSVARLADLVTAS